MKNNRMTRINDEIKNELSELLRSGLKDPRITGVMASCVRAETASDLKYCKVYISVAGNDEQKAACMEAVNTAKGHIRKHVAEAINLRYTPEFKFILDDSLDYSIRIGQLLDDVNINTSEATETGGKDTEN